MLSMSESELRVMYEVAPQEAGNEGGDALLARDCFSGL